MQERGAEAPAVRDITSSGLLAESTFPSGEGSGLRGAANWPSPMEKVVRPKAETDEVLPAEPAKPLDLHRQTPVLCDQASVHLPYAFLRACMILEMDPYEMRISGRSCFRQNERYSGVILSLRSIAFSYYFSPKT